MLWSLSIPPCGEVFLCLLRWPFKYNILGHLHVYLLYIIGVVVENDQNPMGWFFFCLPRLRWSNSSLMGLGLFSPKLSRFHQSIWRGFSPQMVQNSDHLLQPQSYYGPALIGQKLLSSGKKRITRHVRKKIITENK